MRLWAGPEGVLWSCDVRGSVVWVRSGRSGNRGRTRFEELSSPQDAQARAEALIAAREDAGFEVISEDFRFDAPVLRKAKRRIRKSSSRDVLRWCRRELEAHASSLTLRDVATIVSGGPPCDWPTYLLCVETRPGGFELTRRFTLRLPWDPDNDLEHLLVRLETQVAIPDDDELDVSAHDRQSHRSLQAQWLKALEQDTTWSTWLDARVRVASVELQDSDR